MPQPTRLLFVCLGNICRSPLAEGVFTHLAAQRGVRERFMIDSCGLGGWHVGKPPDPRSIAVARRHGVELTSRARRLAAPQDFHGFDLLLAMDRENLDGLRAAGCPEEKSRLFLSYLDDPALPREVPDPYYGGPEGFDHVYSLVVRGSEALLDSLLA